MSRMKQNVNTLTHTCTKSLKTHTSILKNGNASIYSNVNEHVKYCAMEIRLIKINKV